MLGRRRLLLQKLHDETLELIDSVLKVGCLVCAGGRGGHVAVLGKGA